MTTLPVALSAVLPSETDLLRSDEAITRAERLAERLAKSQLIPQTFRGRPDDVFAAFMIAQRMGEDPFIVLSNIHFVNGKPGWYAPYLIARANASGVFTDEISFLTTGEGASLAVTASATLRKSGERVSRTVSLAMAKADGWTKNRKYEAIPEQMLSYRAAVFLIRLYAPGVLYGLHTDDEWEDVAASQGRPIVRSDAPERVVLEPEPEPVRPALSVSSAPVSPETPTLSQAPEQSSSAGPVTGADLEEPVESEGWSVAEAAEWRRALAGAALDYQIAADALEAVGKPRPSDQTSEQRAKSLAWLRGAKGRARYDATGRERTEALEAARALTQAQRAVAAAAAGVDSAPGGLSLVELRALLRAHDRIVEEAEHEPEPEPADEEVSHGR